MIDFDYITIAKRVFAIESQAVSRLSDQLDPTSFTKVVQEILGSEGRVIVCGMGKSGIVGRKIAATLASTSTPSYFMHPGEAYHGDLGMVAPSDIFIAISNSGETDEVIKLIPFLRDNGNFLIAMTGNPSSTLGKAAHAHLNIGVREEACPFQLAPTASTTASMAMGDALAITLMKARNFQPENFARFHPGGSLGRRLLNRVEQEMVAQGLPVVCSDAQILDVLQAMTRGSLGVAIVEAGDEYGIITDGDVRRAIERYGTSIFDKHASDLMSKNPITVPLGTRVEDALILMEKMRITSLPVTDGGRIVGIFKK